MHKRSRFEPKLAASYVILGAMTWLFRGLNVVGECRAARLSLWSCPPFLFVVMGFVNIIVMVASYLLANQYIEEPEIAALIVITITALIFIIGNFVIQGFTRIAEANRVKTEFIAIVSHQLRSPLAIFKWTLDAMSRTADVHAGNEAARRSGGISAEATSAVSYLQILRDNTEKMIQLVNMLLEVSRIEAGRLALRRELVRLDLLTEEIVRSYADYARASNISLSYLSPVGVDPVRGDPEKIKMVIQNLVDNAIRYSSGGGRITIALAPHDRKLVEWKIQDTGTGIPEGQQQFVFQKFFRTPDAVRHQAEGSGLGLYIARSIVTALGGDIGFQSAEAQGSIFWFRLPMYH